MNRETGCDFEEEVMISAKNGFFSEDLKNHLNGCRDCTETAKIARFFQMNFSGESTSQKMPTAGLVWWKSRQREKHLASEQINRANLITQIVAAAVIVAAVIGILIYQPEYFSPIASAVNNTLGAIEQMAAYLFFIFGGFTVIFAVTYFALGRLTADE